MAALRVQLAEAVKTALTECDIEPSFVTERTRRPMRDVKEIKSDGLTVLVVPVDWQEGVLNRSLTRVTLTVHIGVQKKIASQSNTEIDALDEFTESLMSFFRRAELPTFTKATWTACRNVVMCYDEHLGKNVYTSVFALDYTVIT